MCSKPRSFTYDNIESFLETLREDKGDLACQRVVRHPNRNNKSALHFASQMFHDARIIELLIRCGAEVNTCTLRGHTPLIFACGRARDAHVRLLLANQARTRVKTVNGDTAAGQGKGRLEAGTMAQLEQAESTEDEIFELDFRKNADAIAAQIEHAAHCTHCLEKGDWNAHIVQNQKNFPTMTSVVVLENAVKATLADPIALRSVLLDFSVGMAEDSKNQAQHMQTLDICFARVLGTRDALLPTLRALCSDQALAQLLASKATGRANDRRPIRFLFEALLKALHHQPTKVVHLALSTMDPPPAPASAALDSSSVQELVSCCM
jgi:hypothetical protein